MIENLDEKPKKKNNIKKVFIVFLIILVLGLGGYIIYDKIITKSPTVSTKTTATNNKKDKENKEKELDVNSRLVQNLYNSVVDGGINNTDSSKYWMYDKKDFDSTTADELDKMKIVGLNLNSNFSLLLEGKDCTQIPAKINDSNVLSGELTSDCSLHSGTNIDNEYYYPRSYIENLYKSLYGNDAQLDTSKPILIDEYGLNTYVYIDKLDAYFSYISIGGMTTVSKISSSITKATSTNDTITLYETAVESFNDSSDKKTTNYVYTFKLDNTDNLYNFISRKIVNQ